MRTIPLLCCVAIAVILAFARASWGDGEVVDETIGEPIDETTEPITGEAVMPNPGDEQPMRDPFTPYEIGGPAAAWQLSDLEPEEQVVALRGVDDNPQAVQDAYADAARESAEVARAASAANALNIQPLGELGVVP